MQTILRAHVAAQADGPTGIMRLSKPAPDPAGLGPRLDAAGSQDAQDALRLAAIERPAAGAVV